MGAVTMAHVSKLEKDPLKKMIYQNLLRYGPILEYLPFQTVSALRSAVTRWTDLPDVAFRAINAEYTSSTGDVEQVYESVYVFGGEIEIDRIYKKITPSLIQDPEKLQINMMNKSMAYHFMDNFINGDHGVDSNSFNGLKNRISNAPARQMVSATADTTTTVHDPTASAAAARLFIDQWEKAAYRANGGDFDVIVCNEGLKWGLGRVLRYVGVSGGPLLSTSKDQFDREVLTYKGAPILDAGLKKDQVTEIIPDTEAGADAGGDGTSAYFIPFNDEHGIVGIQLSNLEVFDGKKDKSTVDVTTIEWAVGLAGYGSYGPTRLWNIEAPGSWT